MPDKLFFAKATQDEMYDSGNITQVTHFLLYNQTLRVLVDITSDVRQAPLLSAVPKMQVMSEESIGIIEKLMTEGVKEPEKGADVISMSYVKKFECTELVGDQFIPVAATMTQLRDAHSSLDNVMSVLEKSLIKVGLIQPKSIEEPDPLKIRVVDPSTLDADTIKQLEIIVEGIKNNDLKAHFYRQIGNTGKAEQHSGEIAVAEIDRTDISRNASGLLGILERAEISGIKDADRVRIAKKVYAAAHEEGEYDIELRMARDILHLHDKIISAIMEKRLFSVMSNGGGIDIEEEETPAYMSLVKEAAKGIPENRVKAVAALAYAHLMETDSGFGGQNYFSAGQLAKAYLTRNKVVLAGRKLIEVHTKNNYVEGYETFEKAVAELELPEDIVHPLMVEFFARSLMRPDNSSEKIRQKHKLSDGEIKQVVNDTYNDFMDWGNFEPALSLREKYSALIQNKEVSVEVLRQLIGVMHFRR